MSVACKLKTYGPPKNEGAPQGKNEDKNPHKS